MVGTDAADSLSGTPAADVIQAGGGDDFVSAENGADLVCGAAGDDRVEGGTGSDLLLGGPGVDRLSGARGNDRLHGGAGEGDIATGDLGDDRVNGGSGRWDEAAGGLGIDSVGGGPGDADLVSGDYGWDRMSGGRGNADVASFASDISDGDGDGVRASLQKGTARGDGRDRLSGFEALEGSAHDDELTGDGGANLIDGGQGNDRLKGGGGADSADGGPGTDRCGGFDASLDCGPERAGETPLAMDGSRPGRGEAVTASVDPSPAGGGGLVLLGSRGADRVAIGFEPAAGDFTVRSAGALAAGTGCTHLGPRSLSCLAVAPVRRVVADLGSGDDRLRFGGRTAPVVAIRIAAGSGDDQVQGGGGSDLIEAGAGRDRLFGGPGPDGLVGGIPGADRLIGGRGGDLLAAGGGCTGGLLAGGAGLDNASFAETPAHPGVLYASLAGGRALIDAVPGCRPVGLARSNEDLEGSFDYDVLVGDAGANTILGQPGVDRLYGGGGRDVLDARDGRRDAVIACGRRGGSNGRRGAAIALLDRKDPPASRCRPTHAHRPPGVPRT